MSNAIGNVLIMGGKKLIRLGGTNEIAGMHVVIGDPASPSKALVIPDKNALLLAALLGRLDDAAEVAVEIVGEGSALRVSGETFSWWSAVVDCRFPDLALSVPPPSVPAVTVLVDRGSLLNAVKRCAGFSGASYVTLSADKKAFGVLSPKTERGDCIEHIHAEIEYPYAGCDCVITRIDGQTLLKAITACGGDEVELRLPVEARQLAVIRPAGRPEVTVMVSPMLLQGAMS